ncbi:hypothetical protein [Streptomyces sp. JH34]|uniref:hypothetical protein n=1 Tax=Streptomyces sp. JH34 TaxID=2793633 RepID=UPI0023F98970|nr:hypothetical protein [Streptomyces sp. JH34]MDF6023075.1 hypothetical protein [Streptomyces sp. JH34]
MAGATTVVSAMATSAWEVARDRTVALFGRRDEGTAGGEEDPVQAELEASAARVRDAAELDVVRNRQVQRWQENLEDLLRRAPELSGEVTALIDEVGALLPPAQNIWQQSVHATGGGSAYGALGPGSSVHIHHRASPYPSPPPAGATDAGEDTP